MSTAELETIHIAHEPSRRAPSLARRLPRAPLAVAGVLALMALSAFVRTRDFSLGYWIDEGLSIGIADRPLLDIPGVLRLDGSPPLYYMLLWLWLPLGHGEETTHAFSLLFALVTIPVAGWLGWRLWGERGGWIAATLTALNPFLTQYSQETRMYTLAALLGVIATGAFLGVFVYGRRRWWPAIALALAAQLYTHNWALFFAAACGLMWLVLVRLAPAGAPRRALVRDGLKAFGAVALLYLPWVPTLLFQAAHTGAPWALVPPPDALTESVGRLLGEIPQYVLLLAAGAGLVRLLRGRPLSPDGRAALALLGLSAATLGLAWISSQASPAWALRYLAVAVPPLLLLATLGLARAGTLGLVGFALVAVMWAIDGPPVDKSNVRDVATRIAPSLRAGDVVVSTQPEQIPVLSHYLPDGLRYATLWGPVSDVGVADWRDGVERLDATSAERDLAPLIRSLEPGQRLVLVQPIVYERSRWSAEWTSRIRRRSLEWQQFAGEDPRLRAVSVTPMQDEPRRSNPVRATVFVRQAMR